MQQHGGDFFVGLGGLACFLLFASFTLLLMVFWVWMLIDCLTKESSEGNDKIIWAVVILFGSLLGAALYYFVRRPERIRQLGR